MRAVPALVGKELRAIFFSPVAYVLMTGFVLMSSWFFMTLVTAFPAWVDQARDANDKEFLASINVNDFIVQPLIEDMTVLLLVIVPMMTMRVLAEERREGTDQLLHTSPITVGEIVAGKLLGSLLFLVVLLAPTLLYMQILVTHSDPELGPMYLGFVGLFLTGAVFVAIGTFTSSLTENQIVAAVVAFIIELLLFTVGWAATVILNQRIAQIVKYVSLKEHLANFARGVVYSDDLVYFLTMVTAFIFLTMRSVESTRWR